MTNNKKGFTLIELLVVMGILGILMAVTILVINPAEYLARARDTQRINDLNTINSAIGIFVGNGGTISDSACLASTQGIITASTFTGGSCATTATTSGFISNANNGNGWVPLNFSTMAGGSPFAVLPLDPKNDVTYYYQWKSASGLYEIDATHLESLYYLGQKTVANDGGDSNTIGATGSVSGAYEVGTSLTIFK